MTTVVDIRVTVNDEVLEQTVDPRLSLADFLRHQLGLTGTHVGCEHGVCGVCTVICDGQAIRSCLMLAAQADGASVLTIEGLAKDGVLHPLQQGFRERHSFQCGFCTPGFMMSAYALLEERPAPTDAEIREAMASNLCRCTGYQSIIEGVRRAADLLAES